MRLASVLTPMSEENLRWASQCGVSDIVARCPGEELSDLVEVKNRLAEFGLRLSVLEGGLPIEDIKRGGPRRDEEIAAMKRIVRNMAAAEIPICCYNFMAGTDWVRTRLDAPERGGALVTRFDIDQVEAARSLTETADAVGEDRITAGELWANLERFLDEVLPVAEPSGVVLAMHPDDPPLDEFLGRARIMNSLEGFRRLVAYGDSPSNGICFCQGTFAEMGVDIPAAIAELGPHIAYVHFRDIRGTCEHFVETFHDNGPTDMAAAMRAYRQVGFTGPIRPDHVPQLAGEESGSPGYTMLGRLFAYGYIRGLMQATEPVEP